ncbi:MAG: lysylphosphatidylglycerol synthase transmembrane domain-containing protein [Phycisphaerales bacterium]|jgi:hypothetical protein|nr:lysylphosphatidylglycerol synthase transmembrane domain-containing protein [Phycisphaerales bacterium]
MQRRIFTAVRILLVAVGVAVVVYAVNWRTIVTLPAGDTALTGAASNTETTHVVTAMTAAGPGEVMVTTASGLTGEVPLDTVSMGMFDVLGGADPWWLLIGLGLVGCVYPLQTTRWWILMRCRGLGGSWPRTLRLVLVGAFCNFALPGTEGGDVVKAWGAARDSDRRVEAVVSVVFDRITGLAGLVILAAIVGLFVAESDAARQIGQWVGWAALGVGGAAVAAFVIATRGWLRMPDIARRFSGGLPVRLFEAASAYANHPAAVAGATGVSVCVQILLASAAGCAAWSLGVTHDITVILAVVPVLFLVAAVPLFWQGAGVMEAAGIALLAAPEVASVNQVVGFLLLYRAFEFVWGGVGALLMAGGGITLHPPVETTAQ